MDKAIRQLIEVLSVPLRVITGKDVDMRQVKIEFKRNIPANITEIVDVVCKLDGKVDDETLLSLLPFVDNPKEVLEKIKKQKKEAQKQADPYSLENIQGDGENPFPNLNANNLRSMMGGVKEE